MAEPKYAVGQRVRVMKAFPVGHLRTPYYIRGCAGEVERVCGAFPNPEELSQMRSGEPRQTLYRVRFRQRDVWPDYAGAERDVLEVELYEHWLEGE